MSLYYKNNTKNTKTLLATWITLGGILGGILIGLGVAIKPLYVGVLLIAVPLMILFFSNFEKTVLGLLILRSSLDIFSAQQVPAVFAVGIVGLTILYVIIQLLTKQPIQTDEFWWFFVLWIALQSLWLILLIVGGLGLDSTYFGVSFREWFRLFSWLMVYLLIMQLRDKIHPSKVVDVLFLSLILPLTAGFLQVLLPASLLPSFLVPKGNVFFDIEGASRINGTFGHPNTFSSFLLLFIGLTCWKLEEKKMSLPWLLLLGVLIFFMAATKAIVGLVMTGVFIMAYISPKLSLTKLIGGILLVTIIVTLYISTDFGRERLMSLYDTPILNPDIDISKAILLKPQGNSFNWRIAQWTHLLRAWQDAPLLGYGLNTATYIGPLQAYAHNDYIRSLVEGGLLGFFAFIFLLKIYLFRLASILLKSSEKSKERNLCFILIAVLISLMVAMVTENIWSHTTLFFYWLTLMAIVGWNWNKETIEEDFSK